MLAGDKSKPAADASYRNLLWENFHVDHRFDIGTKIEQDKEIGKIDSWGPFFRVSFDLIIHSIDQNSLLSVLSFSHGSGTEKYFDIICIFIYESSMIVNNFFDEYHKEGELSFDIVEKHWYNIVIEQNSIRGKVIQFKEIFSPHIFTIINSRLFTLLLLMGKRFSML